MSTKKKPARSGVAVAAQRRSAGPMQDKRLKRAKENKNSDFTEEDESIQMDIEEAFIAGVEAAAKGIEDHCCVSSCCDAQPSAIVAKQLAKCIRSNIKASNNCKCGHPKNTRP